MLPHEFKMRGAVDANPRPRPSSATRATTPTNENLVLSQTSSFDGGKLLDSSATLTCSTITLELPESTWRCSPESDAGEAAPRPLHDAPVNVGTTVNAVARGDDQSSLELLPRHPEMYDASNGGVNLPTNKYARLIAAEGMKTIAALMLGTYKPPWERLGETQ
eukprot:TRINITY_DN6781_c0_g1_i1.p2 TRINITY_DN6781_c0_g1~~TRINITY_DN6781_c0_g1_i1.p2  ORF type:complete len:163 (-),score=28.27 TRINITY_DN6781_c0_g1_i1:279-767(-)